MVATKHTTKATHSDAGDDVNCIIAQGEGDAHAIGHLFQLAPTNDIRFYLNGVYIDGNRATATNRHIFGTCMLGTLDRPSQVLLRLSKRGRRWLKRNAIIVTEVRLVSGRLAFYVDGVLKWHDVKSALLRVSNYIDVNVVVGQALHATGDDALRRGFGDVLIAPKYLRRAMGFIWAAWEGAVFHQLHNEAKKVLGKVVLIDGRFVHVIASLQRRRNVDVDALLAGAMKAFPVAQQTESADVLP